MNKFKNYILTHKKLFLIAAAALVVASAVAAAFLCTAAIKGSHKGTEAVPEGRIHDPGVFGENVEIFDSANGEIVIDGSVLYPSQPASTGETEVKLTADPDQIWAADTYAGNHTPVEAARMEDGSLGVLTVEKLRLSVNVFESPDQMEAMTRGAAHFPSTSAWDGNVGLSAHNINFDGSDGYFKSLYTLAEGDMIRYQTALGERSYTVRSVREIDASDWSTLGYTDENQLTLITCISGKPEKRLCVQAVE